MSAATTIHRTIRLLKQSLEQLQPEVEDTLVEDIAVMINRAMRSSERSFHTPEHIFALTVPGDPHNNLAALFHDIVYFQVDRGFDDQIEAMLAPYIRYNDETLSLIDNIPAESRAFWGVAGVFGYTPGMQLSPFAGLNEFLSALVLALCLEEKLTDHDLLKVVACIELTIPFRKPNSAGQSPPQQLMERIGQVNADFGLGLSEQQRIKVIERAVAFANNDVENFAEKRPSVFLNNTWKLLPETNPELRSFGVFTISSYRTALMKMYNFMANLDTDSIFVSFHSEPPAERLQMLRERAGRNNAIAQSYLELKLLSAGILEALTRETGKDAPVAYLIGAAEPGGDEPSIMDHLPIPADLRPREGESVLLELITGGRSGKSDFDPSQSPLSIYLYSQLDTAERQQARQSAERYFDGQLTAMQFLRRLPPPLVKNIATAVGKIAFTRTAPLKQLTEQL